MIEQLIQNDLHIVLDDFHHLQNNPEINAAIEFLLTRLPPRLHLVIISRRDPDLELSRLRVLRQVNEITESHLAFNRDEINTLYSDLFDVALDAPSLAHLERKSKAWAAGLVLFYHVLREKTAVQRHALLRSVDGTVDGIASYLGESVFNHLSEEIRIFLLKTSLLSRLDVNFCNRLLSSDRCGELLVYLESNRLLTFRYEEDGDLFYYRHLFRDFLRSRCLQQLGPEAVCRLHATIAGHYESVGEQAEALKHCISGRYFTRACDLLAEIAPQMMIEGRLKQVSAYMQAIPVEYRKKLRRLSQTYY